jgi:hypothetical protein
MGLHQQGISIAVRLDTHQFQEVTRRFAFGPQPVLLRLKKVTFCFSKVAAKAVSSI